MSWLDKFLQDQAELQGNLLGEAEASDIVIDNSSPQQLQAYKNLQDLIKERGGQQRTHQLVNADCVRHLLGTEPHELFKALGLPPSQRNRLPTEAQEALMCGNLAAFYAILEDQSAQGHNGIVRAARQGFSRAAEISRGTGVVWIRGNEAKAAQTRGIQQLGDVLQRPEFT